MIKVAFWYDRPQEYTGGLNYLRNLLYALSTLEDKKIRPYIFFGKRVDAEVVLPFESLATVVRTSVLDRKSLAWYGHQILRRFFGSLLMVHLVIRRHGISIVSHAEHVYGRARPFRIVSWIPDFQYLHLPELFPGLDTAAESQRMRTIAAQTDALILSSHAALDDYGRIADPAGAANVTVLQFVSQPGGALRTAVQPPTRAGVEARYNFEGRFFFLPNQFWQHKNHSVAFAAVKALKERGIEVLLLCTGNLRDYRWKDTTYVDGLLRYIEENGLGQNIKILGAIDYADVLFLMRRSVAVLNPSRFEGWSSTVEEAKGMGKRLIVSGIPVHREQDPPGASFFDVDDSQALAEAMATHWASSTDTIGSQDAHQAAQDLHRRTTEYAEGYTRLVLALGRSVPDAASEDNTATGARIVAGMAEIGGRAMFISPLIRKLTFMRAMGLRYALWRASSAVMRPRIRFGRHIGAFRGVGLEIGGPSAVFKGGDLFPAYASAERVDNVTFSNKTRWEGDVAAGPTFAFHPRKARGTQFVLEGGSLSSLPASNYDFILSCHMLEHTANPLRVLHEWKRLLKPGGKLLLILPHRDGSFDHRRPVTPLAHLVEDFENQRGEDDTTHLPEILALHDLRRDPLQASRADFEQWIRDNETNRGAHHHVFDIELSVRMLTQAGLQVDDVQAAMPFHIFLLTTRLPADQSVNNQRFLAGSAESYRSSPFHSDRQRASAA